jgi:enoyl-[acyl-carrier protein] reductase I
MGIMDGKRGVIFGVANDRSYAWFIARQLLSQGAQCAFTHLPGEKNERRVRNALEDLDVSEPWLAPCDVGSDEDIDAIFDRLHEDFGHIDFIVHSLAFADKRFLQVGRFHATPREAWAQALDISAYSLVAIARRASPLMRSGGSIVCMSYYGGEKVMAGYNVMGIAKAALEHATRYLAMEMGARGVRVNAISGGPLRTIAAMAVSGIDLILDHQAAEAPLRRNITGEEVGDTATFLLSDMASGITGEVIHVDAGHHILGSSPTRESIRTSQ